MKAERLAPARFSGRGRSSFLGGMTPTSGKPSTVAGYAGAHGAPVADPLPFTPIVRAMRAVVISDFGGPEVLRVASRPDPVPGTGEIVVRVAGSGVNRVDLFQRRGICPPPPGESEGPGLEFRRDGSRARSRCSPVAARPARQGDRGGVPKPSAPWNQLGRRLGQHVMGTVAGGGYAKRWSSTRPWPWRRPRGWTCCGPGGPGGLHDRVRCRVFCQAGLTPGETLLIHAVGSGVGTAALQLARRAGVRSPSPQREVEPHLDRFRPAWPACATVPTTRHQAVKEATCARGADVILDLVGGPSPCRAGHPATVPGQRVQRLRPHMHDDRQHRWQLVRLREVARSSNGRNVQDMVAEQRDERAHLVAGEPNARRRKVPRLARPS